MHCFKVDRIDTGTTYHLERMFRTDICGSYLAYILRKVWHAVN